MVPLLPAVDRALRWIEHNGDADGDGFVEYRAGHAGRPDQPGLEGLLGRHHVRRRSPGRRRRSPSPRCRPTSTPRTGPARSSPRPPVQRDAAALRRQARRHAQARFNDDFWMPGAAGSPSLSTRDKRQVDALASNMGHCLWTGIVDDEQGRRRPGGSVSAELFSGWGMRTLAPSMARVQPDELPQRVGVAARQRAVAAGLMRYGFVEHAQRVPTGCFDARARTSGTDCRSSSAGFRDGVRRARADTRPRARRRRGRLAAPAAAGAPRCCCVHARRPSAAGRRVWCAPAVPGSATCRCT